MLEISLSSLSSQSSSIGLTYFQLDSYDNKKFESMMESCGGSDCLTYIKPEARSHVLNGSIRMLNRTILICKN